MEPFRLKRLADRSDEALIAEIQRVAAIVPGKVMTRRDFEQHSRRQFKHYRQTFRFLASWSSCRRACSSI